MGSLAHNAARRSVIAVAGLALGCTADAETDGTQPDASPIDAATDGALVEAGSGTGGDGGGGTGGSGAAGGGEAGTGGKQAPDAAGICNHDGIVDPWELCDDGNDDDDDGCRQDCTWSCDPASPSSDQACNDGLVCNGREMCGANHRCQAGSLPPNGTPCGDTVQCVDGACVFVNCGDGKEQPELGEECDDGNTIRGDGCEPDCRWSCLPSDGTRDCRNPCREPSTCTIATHLCTFAAPRPDGTSCPRGTCTSGVCVPN